MIEKSAQAVPTRMAPRLIAPARAEIAVDPDDPVFTGHYPGFPVLPGVYLVEFADQAVRLCLGDDPARLVAIERCRFLQPVYPGDRLELEIALSAAGGELRSTASMRTAAGPVAEVRLRHATEVAR
jgi:3-hydroxyacyl-[acyl-carrier-protein] dehydratase